MRARRKKASRKWFALDVGGRRIYLPRVEGQLQQYLPVLILLLVATAFAAGSLIFSKLIGKRARTNPTKDTPYECGMPPEGEGSTRMSVKFYLVAMLFILFDIEVVFLYPWAVVYKDMLATHAALILGSMLSFLGILFVGYIYALKKKAFDWKR
jgi:NADH-quinone oxidoreductase subunit A